MQISLHDIEGQVLRVGIRRAEKAHLPTHALGDAIAVLGHDALNIDGTAAAVHALVLDALDATR